MLSATLRLADLLNDRSEGTGDYTPCWQRAASTPKLEGTAVHIWRADLEAKSSGTNKIASLLAPDERERAARFHFQRDRDHYTTGRGLLRVLLSRYLDRPPASVSLYYSSRGKPHLSSSCSLSFNLSHSNGRALYAFARQGEIGIDIQEQNVRLAVTDVARRVFTAGEMDFVSQATPGVERERFFYLWCRKEAYLKARSAGFSIAPDSFDSSLRAAIEGFALYSFIPIPGFSAALAMKPAASQISFFDFDTLQGEWNE